MYRPIAKYVVRIALFASTLAAIACSNPTGPSPVTAKKSSLKDSTTFEFACKSGYTIVNGVVTCNDGM